MILIFSKSDLEHTTDEVISWIISLNGKFIRININELFNAKLSYKINNSISPIEEKNSNIVSSLLSEADIKMVNVVWYRRGLFLENHLKDELNSLKFDKNNIANLKKSLNAEIGKSALFFYRFFNEKNWLSKWDKLSVDKLDVLEKAAMLKIDIPKTLITNNKQELFDFYLTCNKKIITKPLTDSPSISDKNYVYMLYTTMINENELDEIPDLFFPSLFQEYIEKTFEIRSFFIEDKFYSMAIFSQKDAKTCVDFRDYNFKNPNRCVPYNLPNSVEDKLRALMKKLELNTGSLDIIKTKEGKFIFLEVNPVGQFGMTSRPCNYNLEKKVAEFLIKQDYEKE